MGYVEFPKEEAGIDFDGSFEFEYLPNGAIKITPYSSNGEVIRVPRKIYAQMCQFARNQLSALQEQVSEMIVTSKY